MARRRATPHEEVDAPSAYTYLPGVYVQPWGPEVVLNANHAAPARRPSRPTCRPPPDPTRFLQLHFLDHDPEEGWADGYAKIGDAINSSGLADRCVGPASFIPTDFGTDRYTDRALVVRPARSRAARARRARRGGANEGVGSRRFAASANRG